MEQNLVINFQVMSQGYSKSYPNEIDLVRLGACVWPRNLKEILGSNVTGPEVVLSPAKRFQIFSLIAFDSLELPGYIRSMHRRLKHMIVVHSFSIALVPWARTDQSRHLASMR